MRRIHFLAVAACTAALMVPAPNATAAAVLTGGGVLLGHVLPTASAPSGRDVTVTLYAEHDTLGPHGPASVSYASQQAVHTTIGSSFRLIVPPSWFHSGYANVTVGAVASGAATEYSTTAYQGKTTAFAMGAAGTWGAPSALADVTGPAGPDTCHTESLPDEEHATRIGEMHVANQAGMSGRFVYAVEDDSNIDVGLDTGGGWHADGSVHFGGSLSTSGGVTLSRGERWYINSHFYYKYWFLGKSDEHDQCAVWRKVKATDYVGDVFRSARRPPTNPWGTCHRDPDGLSTVDKNGTWDDDRGKATHYSASVIAFGFHGGSQSGYTSHVKMTWHNGSRTKVSYVCGPDHPRTARTLYNSAS